MEQINLQTEQLKLNVTNIKSFLIDSNKKLKKQKITKETLIRGSVEKKKFRSEENRLESRLNLGGITRIGATIAGKTLSLFDKLKEFLGILLVGFIINRLPKIIAGIKKFFDDNPWIGKSVKFVIDIIGKGFNGIVSLVEFFSPEKRDQVKKDIEDLDKGFKKLNSELDSDISSLSSISVPEENDNRTDDSSTILDSQTIDSTDTKKTPSFAPPEKPRLKKYSQGGKVSSSSASKSSVAGKKSFQTTGYFSTFRSNYVGLSLVQEQNEKNRESFEKIVEQMKEMGFSSLSGGEEKPMHREPGSRGAPGSPGLFTSPSQIFEGLPDSAIVGRVGYTGNTQPKGPDGAHVHIETGSGRKDSRGPVPSHIFDKVIVGGRPLSQWNMNSGYGMRWGKLHAGHDFAMSAGNPIQLHKDLKLVEYAPGHNAGYGNLIMFQDKSGNTYIITHLQSGPERAPKDDKPTPAGQGQKGKGNGKGGAIQPLKTPQKISEDTDEDEISSVFVQPIIIKQNTPVLVPFG